MRLPREKRWLGFLMRDLIWGKGREGFPDIPFPGHAPCSFHGTPDRMEWPVLRRQVGRRS